MKTLLLTALLLTACTRDYTPVSVKYAKAPQEQRVTDYDGLHRWFLQDCHHVYVESAEGLDSLEHSGEVYEAFRDHVYAILDMALEQSPEMQPVTVYWGERVKQIGDGTGVTVWRSQLRVER